MLVEPRGVLVDHVDHDESSGNGLGRGKHSFEGFGQQGASETPTVQRSVEH